MVRDWQLRRWWWLLINTSDVLHIQPPPPPPDSQHTAIILLKTDFWHYFCNQRPSTFFEKHYSNVNMFSLFKTSFLSQRFLITFIISKIFQVYQVLFFNQTYGNLKTKSKKTPNTYLQSLPIHSYIHTLKMYKFNFFISYILSPQSKFKFHAIFSPIQIFTLVCGPSGENVESYSGGEELIILKSFSKNWSSSCNCHST